MGLLTPHARLAPTSKTKRIRRCTLNDDTIKQFPSGQRLPDNPLKIADRHPGWCDHTSIVIDRHTRSVQCANAACSAVLDPFGYLLSNAMTIQNAWAKHREVTRQAAEVAERVSVLKKEEQRLRAMVKRLQEKTGAVVTVRTRDAL